LESRVESVDHSMRLFRLATGDVTMSEVDAVALRYKAKADRSMSGECRASH